MNNAQRSEKMHSVTVWDNGELTADRYTVKIKILAYPVRFYSLSDDCLLPRGWELGVRKLEWDDLDEEPVLSKDDKPLDRQHWPKDLRIGIARRIKKLRWSQGGNLLSLTEREFQVGSFKILTHYENRHNAHMKDPGDVPATAWCWFVSFDNTGYDFEERKVGLGIAKTETKAFSDALDYIKSHVRKSEEALSALDNIILPQLRLKVSNENATIN